MTRTGRRVAPRREDATACARWRLATATLQRRARCVEALSGHPQAEAAAARAGGAEMRQNRQSLPVAGQHVVGAAHVAADDDAGAGARRARASSPERRELRRPLPPPLARAISAPAHERAERSKPPRSRSFRTPLMRSIVPGSPRRAKGADSESTDFGQSLPSRRKRAAPDRFTGCMRRLLVRLSLALPVAAAPSASSSPPSSSAAVTCPNAVPVVNENNCKGEGSSDWLFDNYDEGIAGFATQTSFNVGQSVPLKIARDTPDRRAAPKSTSTSSAWATTAAKAGGWSTPPATSRSPTTSTAKPRTQTTGELQLRQLERHPHDPRVRAADDRRLRRQADHGRRHAARKQHRLRRSATTTPRSTRRSSSSSPPPTTRPTTPGAASPSTTTASAAPTPSPGPAARRQGLLRPARSTRQRRTRPLLRARLRNPLLAGEAGLRRLLHRRRRRAPERRPAAQTTKS